MKTSKLDLIAMQKQFDDILSKLTKEEVEEYCNEINSIKTRIGYKESQPVISEEEIKKNKNSEIFGMIVSDMRGLFSKQYDDEEAGMHFKQRMRHYENGILLSLSSNDKQEKKPTETGEVIASYDEVKYTEELIKKLNYNTVYTCDTRKSESGSVSTFKKDLLYTPAGWIGLDDGYIVTSVLIPVYYPERKGGDNEDK